MRTITFAFSRLWGIALASSLLVGKGPKDEDQDESISPGEFGGWAWHEGWAFPLTSVPIVGQVFRTALDDRPARDVSLTPFTRPLDAIVKSIKATEKAATSEEGDSDATLDAFLSWMEAGGQFAGAPVSQIRRTARYWNGSERTGEESVLQDAYGSAFGPEQR